MPRCWTGFSHPDPPGGASVALETDATWPIPSLPVTVGGAGRCRIVVTDRIVPVDDNTGVLLHAARFAPLPGDVHRLAATNPVFLVWGTVSRGASS